VTHLKLQKSQKGDITQQHIAYGEQPSSVVIHSYWSDATVLDD